MDQLSPEVQALLQRYGITPEQFDQMARAGMFKEESAALEQPSAFAQSRMEAPMPDGRMVSGFYVPPSPMASLGALAGKMMGGAQYAGLQGKQRTLLDDLRKGRGVAGVLGMKDRDSERRLIEDLLRRAQQPQPQPDQIPPLLARPPEGY